MTSGRDDDRSERATHADTDPVVPATRARLSVENYEIGALIGKGGMGEVLLARDARIGRDVAIKRMAHADPDAAAVARFLREAKIQARLEHPAIVPVHEIGVDVDGNPYFTMKRLVGTTLHEVVRKPDVKLQRVLRALVDVCHAVQLAHQNGIVHRDLKPSNIMLGDFGEVYVLDWGVARVVAEDAGDAANVIAPISGETEAGAVLGTPGYMAPEQLHDASRVGPPADVYSLGAILFEILTGGEPLHPRGVAAIASTLAGADDPPSRRAGDRAIPPELDAACLAALAREPADRVTADELGERIQRYLDGDRDLERRKSLAAEYFAIAHEAAADPARRAEAMRAAGRAVGLDPQSDAVALVTRLLLEPPAEHPPELARMLAGIDHDISVKSARGAAAMMAAFFVVLPIFIWNGITSWPLLGAIAGVFAFCSLSALYQAHSRRTRDILNLFLGAVLCVVISRFLGPFVFVPGLVCATLVGLGQQGALIGRPVLLVSVGLAAFLLPIALEVTNVFGSTFTIADDRVALTSRVVDLGGATSYVLLVLPNVAFIVATAMFASSLAASRRDAQHDTAVRAWHLQKLLPD